jgi:peptidoglycan/LPS O-acetylase OafA/YrhL
LPADDQRIEIIPPLRGLAALSVLWFHLSGHPPLHDGSRLFDWIEASGAYGWLGVEAFFVISGFILPYSMHRAGYRLRDFGRFLAKRLVRLEPPYLAALALSVSLAYASTFAPGYRGDVFEWEPVRLALHFGYLNTFFGYPWYNLAFWTLAIEFQFYLLLALAYPLVVHRHFAISCGFPVLLASLGLVDSRKGSIIHWLGLFALGMLAFQVYGGLVSRRMFFVLFVVVSALNHFAIGPAASLVGAATAVAIPFLPAPGFKPFVFLGTISYSLYLIHVPIGLRVTNLGLRLFVDSTLWKAVVLAISFGACIVAAWIMYRLIELPAQRWSSRIRYKSRPQSMATEIAPVAPP